MGRKRRSDRLDLKEIADVSSPQKIIDLEEAEQAWVEEAKKATPLKARAREKKIIEKKNTSTGARAAAAKLAVEIPQAAAPQKGKIDLHGLSETKAWEFLEKIIPEMANSGVKEILLITGKGGEDAVLRKITPRWLLESKLKKYVSKISQASKKQGGEGALLVRIIPDK
jgi:DNA-nicking Smr family endonuclease